MGVGYAGHEASPFTGDEDLPPSQTYDWVVHDMTRPDNENPAFGPMTEAQKDELMANSKDKGGPYNYWAQKIGGGS